MQSVISGCLAVLSAAVFSSQSHAVVPLVVIVYLQGSLVCVVQRKLESLSVIHCKPTEPTCYDIWYESWHSDMGYGTHDMGYDTYDMLWHIWRLKRIQECFQWLFDASQIISHSSHSDSSCMFSVFCIHVLRDKQCYSYSPVHLIRPWSGCRRHSPRAPSQDGSI